MEQKQFNYFECRMCWCSILKATIWVLKQFLLAAAKGMNKSHATNHVCPLKVSVTHDSDANDEMLNKCEHIAIC